MDVWGLPLVRIHSTSGRAITAKTFRRGIVHGTAIGQDECTTHTGLALTTPARTVVDIARSTDHERAVCVGDSALRRGLVTVQELSGAVESARYRAGVPRAVKAVAAMTDRSESVGESRSRLLFAGAGLELLLNQSIYDADGTFLGRVDFLFRGFWVIGEFDGAGNVR